MLKRSLFVVAAIAVFGASYATTFSNDLVVGTIDGALAGNFVVSSAGSSHLLTVTNFTLDGANMDYGDIAWSYDFADAPVPFLGVKLTLDLTLQSTNADNAFFMVFGDEKVFDSSNNVVADSHSELYPSVAAGNPQPYEYTVDIPFAYGVTSGTAAKDLLYISASDNALLTVNSIKQTYYPVPEPASMAALGLGLVGIIARRRKA